MFVFKYVLSFWLKQKSIFQLKNVKGMEDETNHCYDKSFLFASPLKLLTKWQLPFKHYINLIGGVQRQFSYILYFSKVVHLSYTLGKCLTIENIIIIYDYHTIHDKLVSQGQKKKKFCISYSRLIILRKWTLSNQEISLLTSGNNWKYSRKMSKTSILKAIWKEIWIRKP